MMQIQYRRWDKVDEWMSKHPALIRIFSRFFVNALKGEIDVDEQ